MGRGPRGGGGSIFHFEGGGTDGNDDQEPTVDFVYSVKGMINEYINGVTFIWKVVIQMSSLVSSEQYFISRHRFMPGKPQPTLYEDKE